MASQGASVAAGYSGDRDNAELFVKEFERDFDGPGRGSSNEDPVSASLSWETGLHACP